MNEGLKEALKNIKIRCHSKVVWDDPIDRDLKLIEQALQRLEAIDNANFSEALERFDYIGNDIIFAYDDDYVSYDYTDDVEYIKQSLLKAQEQEKVINELKTLVKCAELNECSLITLAVLKNTLKEYLK